MFTVSSFPAKFITLNDNKEFDLRNYSQFMDEYKIDLIVRSMEDLQYLINKNYVGNLEGILLCSNKDTKYFTKPWLVKNISVEYYEDSDNLKYYNVSLSLDPYYNKNELAKILAQKIPTTMDEYNKRRPCYDPFWNEFDLAGPLKYGTEAWDKVMKELKEDERKNKMVKIKDVFVNKEKQTIVVKWENGETTKVTCDPADKWDIEKGVAIAIAKFYLGNNFNAGELFKRYLKKAERSEALAKKETKKVVKKNETH